MMDFGIKIYGYDSLLSKEKIENFGVKALDFSFSTGFLFCKKVKYTSYITDRIKKGEIVWKKD